MERKLRSFHEWINLFPQDLNILEIKDLEFIETDIQIDSNRSFLFRNCKLKNLKIVNAGDVRFYDESECNNISIVEGSRLDLFQYFNSKVTGELKIITSSGEIGLDNSIINRAFLHPNFGKFKSLSVNLCTFNELTLNRFLPHENETVKFELYIVKQRVNIYYSILDKVGFNGLDLKDAQLKILDSSIVKANYYSITWPMSYKIIETINDRRLNQLDIGDVIKLQEIYRQLKTVSLNNSNKVDAKKFLKNEMRIYHQLIILQRKSTSIKNIFAYLSLSIDSLMLGINKYVTDYGESIIRPTSSLILIGFLFFWYWMKPLGIQFELNIEKIDWMTTKLAYGYFFNFLNPVHAYNISNINGCSVNLFGISDFLMRLISGFLIYHIVRSTRKFNFSV
ncbi:MAG: hypothetical protein ACK5TU_06725 [Cyclobacteriaceae bacterium]|jgi:hypothetical protein